MVRIISLIFILFIYGCSTIRGIEVCRIRVKKGKCQCSGGKKNYSKPLDYCEGFIAASEVNLRKIANKLQNCKEQSETNK